MKNGRRWSEDEVTPLTPWRVFMEGADVDAFNRAAFKLLKPGGVFVIIDHAARAGLGLKNTKDLHRMDPAALRAKVQKAGFVFDGESKVLANPDIPIRPRFSIPPSRAKPTASPTTS